MRRGWLARPGDEFVLSDPSAAHHLRLTAHDLTDAEHIRYNDALRKRAAEISRARANRTKTQTWPI